MSRQEGRRLRRLTGRTDPGKKVAEPRAPSLNGTLPAGYGKTRIALLPIDPYLVHVYWEVSGGGMGFVKALIEAGALKPQAVLRFHDVTAMPVGGVRAEGSFDVDVDIESRNWYVHLLSPEKSYVVDLGFRDADGRFHRIARSNRGETPRAWPCEETGEQHMRVVEVDGIIHADPVEVAEFEQDSGTVSAASEVSEGSGRRPRVEIPQEDRRAVVGMAGAPAVTLEAERVRETGHVHPPSNLRRVVFERRQSFPPDEKGAAGREPPKGEEQGPAGADLSLLCDRLLVSGLSSSRITVNGKKDDQDDG